MQIPSPPDAPVGVGVVRRGPIAAVVGSAVVIAAWALLYLWGLGAAPFHTKGEPREALVVWEMTHGGSRVLPRRNGTEIPAKPPLFHWLGAAATKARGSLDEISVRLPSAIAALLGALLVCWTGCACWGAGAGTAGALSLLTMFEWVRAGTSARVDMTLTLGIEIALLGFLFFLRQQRQLWLIPFYAGMGLAVLGKGPVGLALPVLIAATTALAHGNLGALRRARPIVGVLVVVALAGSWYTLAYREAGDEFLRKQLLDENVFRMLGSAKLTGGHRHSPIYLLGAFALGLMPWTLVLPAVAVALWRTRGEGDALDGRRYSLMWALFVVAFYSLPASKRGVYLLAGYPAVALLVGWWWQHLWKVATEPSALSRALWTLLALVVAGLATVVGLAVLADAHSSVLDIVPTLVAERDAAGVAVAVAALRAHPGLTAATTAGVALGGLLMASASYLPKGSRWIPAALVLAMASVILLVRQIVLPAVAQAQTQKHFMTAIYRQVDPNETVYSYGALEYGALFYANRHVPRWDGDFPTESPRYLLMPKKTWVAKRAAALFDYREVAIDSPSLVLIERLRGLDRPQPVEP